MLVDGCTGVLGGDVGFVQDHVVYDVHRLDIEICDFDLHS